jgi:tetratricopeptide (TPR) repeat protein
MRSLLYRALILLAVIGLIVTPPVLSGYAELNRADILEADGNILQAAGHYERAAYLLPWQPGLWEKVGIAKFHLGNFPLAISILEKERPKNALSDAGWYTLGLSYWWAGDQGKALSIWQTGLEKYPSFTRFYGFIAGAFLEQGDTTVELNAIERWIVAEGANNAWGHYRLGQLLSVSDPERALKEFLLAASLEPQFSPAMETMRTSINLASLEIDESSKLVIIGRGLGLVSEWSLAAEAFRQAVAADGENAEAWAWLGEAEQQLGRDGRTELDKALSLGHTNPIVRSLRGLYWTRQDRGDQALAEYLLAAEYDPDNPAWQISIGAAYALRGDLQAALGAYLRATEMDPTDARLWRLLAAFSARHNMQVEDVGLPAARKAVDLSGEDPLALDALGWTLALLERFDQAQEALEHALRLDPQLATAHLHLGIVAMQTDDWEAAREHLQQARDLDTDDLVGEQAQLLLNQYFP